MSFLEKFQSLIILVAVLIGLAMSQITQIAEQAGQFILPFLLLMLLGVFIQLPLREIAAAFKHGKVTGLSLLINFVTIPFLPRCWVGCF